MFLDAFLAVISYEKDWSPLPHLQCGALVLSYSQKSRRIIMNRKKVSRLDINDFPVADESLGVNFFRVSSLPWPPKASIHPPSMFFWSVDPAFRAGRDVA